MSNELTGFDTAQESSISNILLDNFISFYDWGFLNKGGYYNNVIPSSGMYGGNKSVLKPVQDPNYENGQVWQGYRPNWVWETGVSVGTPISISGVFVNSVFRSTTNTTQPYHIDYTNGRVVFDTPLSLNTVVKLEYSNKWVNVIPTKGIPWFRDIQQGVNRIGDQFNYYGSGSWAQLGQTRIPLPAIAIDVTPINDTKPYQLGGGQWVNNNIVFHVIAENDWECQNLIDKIVYQNDKTIVLYNSDQVVVSGVAPLDQNNSLTPNALPSGLYPNLVGTFPHLKCYIRNSQSSGGITQLSPDLYIGSARCVAETKPI